MVSDVSQGFLLRSLFIIFTKHPLCMFFISHIPRPYLIPLLVISERESFLQLQNLNLEISWMIKLFKEISKMFYDILITSVTSSSSLRRSDTLSWFESVNTLIEEPTLHIMKQIYKLCMISSRQDR